MKKLYHKIVAIWLFMIHPKTLLPSFKYYAKHVDGRELTDEEIELLKKVKF